MYIRAEVCFEISVTSAPLAKSSIMSMLTVHCQWEDQTAKKGTGHPPSFSKANKNEINNASYLLLPFGLA